jgi:hypothetical protein
MDEENFSPQEISSEQIEEILKTSDIDESLENILLTLDEQLRNLEIRFQALVNSRRS